MPDVISVDRPPIAPTQEGTAALRSGPEVSVERQPLLPIDEMQRLIRTAQLVMASQRGEQVEPQGVNWEDMKKIPTEQWAEMANYMQGMIADYGAADLNEKRTLSQLEDPHPNDPYSSDPEWQHKRYLKEKEKRRERGEIPEVVLPQTNLNRYLDNVTLEALNAAKAKDEAYQAVSNGDEATKENARRQLDAHKQLQNLLIEIKSKDSETLNARELETYLSRVRGLRGQALGTLDDTLEQAVAEFAQKAEPVIDRYREMELQASEGKRGVFGQRELTPEDREIINDTSDDIHKERRLDKLFNRIFEKADVDQSVDFASALDSAGRQEWSDLKTAMTDALKIENNPNLRDATIIADLQSTGTETPTRNQIIEERKKRLHKLQKRLLQYTAEHEVRENTHNANYVVLTGAGIQEMQKYTSRFRNSHADLAFRQRGVMEAYRYYNQALLRIKSKYGGYLPQSAMIVNPGTGQRLSEVDELAYSMFRDALSKGVVRDPKTYESLSHYVESPDTAPELNEMEDWEIDRAFGMARGLGIMMGTTIEVAAQSVIPSNTIVSLYARPIVEKLQVFQTIQKYDIGGAKNSLFAMFLDKDKRWTRDEFQYFYGLMHDDPSKAMAIMNGLIEEDYDRLSRKLNVFGLGGIVSRTAWRAGHDPVTGALGSLTEEDLDWVGSGLMIEKYRGALNGHGRLSKERSDHLHQKYGEHVHDTAGEARLIIRDQLTKTKELAPLVLYQKIPKVQDKVLRRLFASELAGLGVKHLGDTLAERKAFENTYNSTYLNEGIIQTLLKANERYKQGGEYTKQVDSLIERMDRLVLSLSVRQDAALKRRDSRIEDTARDKSIKKRIYELPRDVGAEKQATFTGMGEMSAEELAFVNSAREAFDVDEYIELLKDKDYRQPYILDVTGMDMQEIFWQVPGEDTMARRWGDHSAAENGAAAVTEFMRGLSHFNSPEELIKPLEEIYAAVSDYDASYATQLVMDLSEAAAKFYSKDWYYRMPGFVGATLGLTQGAKEGTSFAQAVMGPDAPSWDEIDVDKLFTGMRKVKLLTGENINKVRKKTIGKKGKVIVAYARFIIPLAIAAGIFFLTKEATEESSSH